MPLLRKCLVWVLLVLGACLYSGIASAAQAVLRQVPARFSRLRRQLLADLPTGFY